MKLQARAGGHHGHGDTVDQSGISMVRRLSIAQMEECTKMPAARFVTSFESLGTNCEFGFVQRYCGAEPVSLLRFAGFSLQSLLACLGRRFEGLGLIENLSFSLKDAATREYEIRDKAFAMELHAMKYEGPLNVQSILAQHSTRLMFLRRKLIKDLEQGTKIFVWKSDVPVREKDVFRLHDAMNRYSANTLFWVVEADADHPPGWVEWARPRLLKGYIDRFGPPENVPDVSLDVWLALCVNAVRLAHSDRDVRMRGNPSDVASTA